MSPLNFSSITAQVAAHLRKELVGGRWSGTMPGRNRLAEELEVSRKTVQGALALLQKEGLLVSQGAGRPRRIVEREKLAPRALRLAILDYEPLELTEEWSIAMHQRLMDQGHRAFFVGRSQIQLRFNLNRIASLVKRTPADAWVVCSGPREVLKWFAQHETPAFAMFGRRQGLPIAGVGPDHAAAGRAAVRRLIALGHQRIVVLVRKSQRAGGAGHSERAIFEEMAAHGLPSGPYNLPDWEDSSEGFHRMLDELFRITPPTALIVDEPFLFHAAKDHLAQRGILAPTHASLICADPDRTFAWCKPSVAHIRWDHRPVVRRVVRWAANVARGTDDRRQTLTKAEFVDGGTVGRAPSAR